MKHSIHNRKVLAGGKRRKGEKLSGYNSRSHQSYKGEWVKEKKLNGQWLSKEEYEKKTGRAGKK